MKKAFPTLVAILSASTLTLSAQTLTDSTSTTRTVDLIDPAAFGFGRPGYMVDTTLIDTQDFANRPGGLDFMEVRTILPLWTKKMNALRVSASLSYNLSELDFNGFLGLQRETLHTLEAQVSLFWRPEHSKMVGAGILHAGARHGFPRAVVG
jgi:hypothetical protein